MTDQPPNNEILRTVKQFRDALAREDARALGRLVDAYERIYARLQDKINLLIDGLEMTEPTGGELVRMQRYKDLIRQTEAELRDYQAILRNEIQGVSQNAINFASRDAARLLRVMGGQYGVTVGFNRLPTETIKTLLGFLSEDGTLYQRISKLAETNAQYVADKILEGVSLGQNPRVIAGIIRDSLGGGLTDALRMTRTVQLWTYREATRANYLANSDVVDGWIWYADLGGDACMACIAEHGTVHGLDETLDDHYNGRCSMIPVVSGFPPIVEENGETWFSQQPEAKQRELMGPGRYDAWKDGKINFSQLIGKHDDAVYGSMTVEATLESMLGGG